MFSHQNFPFVYDTTTVIYPYYVRSAILFPGLLTEGDLFLGGKKMRFLRTARTKM